MLFEPLNHIPCAVEVHRGNYRPSNRRTWARGKRRENCDGVVNVALHHDGLRVGVNEEERSVSAANAHDTIPRSHQSMVISIGAKVPIVMLPWAKNWGHEVARDHGHLGAMGPRCEVIRDSVPLCRCAGWDVVKFEITRG